MKKLHQTNNHQRLIKSKILINNELTIIHTLFPSNQTELYRTTPFQLLVAVILSAQCTDKQVNKVTHKLFQIVSSPWDIIKLWEEELKNYIKSIWFFRSKARNIMIMSWQVVWENYKWVIPRSLEELTQLAWVGIKTAKVVAHTLYGDPYIAVDTHVHRVTNRLGRVHTSTPEQTSKIIEWIIFPELRSIAHHSLILFGRYHCKARKPLCESCPLYTNCEYYRSLMKEKWSKIKN